MNSDGKLFCVCDDNKFYDANKNACVTEDACEGYTYRLDGRLLQCVDEKLCFERGNYAVEKDGKRQCVEECPSGTFLDVSDTFRRCISNCDERFVDDVDGLKCTSECEDEMFDDQTSNGV